MRFPQHAEPVAELQGYRRGNLGDVPRQAPVERLHDGAAHIWPERGVPCTTP